MATAVSIAVGAGSQSNDAFDFLNEVAPEPLAHIRTAMLNSARVSGLLMGFGTAMASVLVLAVLYLVLRQQPSVPVTETTTATAASAITATSDAAGASTMTKTSSGEVSSADTHKSVRQRWLSVRGRRYQGVWKTNANTDASVRHVLVLAVQRRSNANGHHTLQGPDDEVIWQRRYCCDSIERLLISA